MLNPEPKTIRTFSSGDALAQWLSENHASASELWVKIFKKGSGIPSVDWLEIVLETLCWGWIDGVKKSLDSHSYLQRITPRKANSGWSKKNTAHVERLTAEGRMQEPGLAQVRAAKEDGRWDRAYAPASEMRMPTDFLTALEQAPAAKRFFESLSKSSQYVIMYGLSTAKKVETRQRRFEKFMDMLLREVKPDFGFNKTPKA